MSFQEDIQIDVNALDYEWEVHSSKYLKVSEEFADAIYRKDAIKFKLEVAEASVDMDIRKNFRSHGFDVKPTEVAIKNTVAISPDVQRLAKELVRCTHAVNMMQAAKGAFEHKKKALEKLTDLYLSGYWAEPRIQGEAKKKFLEDGSDQVQAQLGSNKSRIVKAHQRAQQSITEE